MPNQALQRTGSQRCCVAWWFRQRLAVVRPPPLSLGVDMTSDVKSSRKNSQSVFFMVMSSWQSGPSEEVEPVKSDG
jgi:hypothetical protein